MNNTTIHNATPIAVKGGGSFFIDMTNPQASVNAEGIFQKIWDNISDFFCRTHVAEAKQHLRNFLDPNKFEFQRAQSFTALRDLCAPACQHHFMIGPAKPDEKAGVAFQVGSARLVTDQLIGVNLKGANLRGANLAYAKLNDANLTDADLTNANLNRADMTGTQLDGAILPAVEYIAINDQAVKAVNHHSGFPPFVKV